jgi:hypothetical protein
METVRTMEQVNTPGNIVPFSTETLEKQQDVFRPMQIANREVNDCEL